MLFSGQGFKSTDALIGGCLESGEALAGFEHFSGQGGGVLVGQADALIGGCLESGEALAGFEQFSGQGGGVLVGEADLSLQRLDLLF